MEERDPYIISWDAPEYHFIEKTSDWFWVLGIVTASIAILSIIFGYVLFALFVILAGLCIGLLARQGPIYVHYELHPKGVTAGEVFYSYKTLASYWLDEHHPLPRIILKSKKMLMPYIVINLNHVPPEEIGAYLAEYLPEVEHEETWAHRLFEHFGL